MCTATRLLEVLMSLKVSLAGLLVLAVGAMAGCATSASDPYYSASPTMSNPVTTNAPQVDNADAAGLASVPGTRTGVAPAVIVPEPAAASPVIVVPPPQPR